MKRAAVPILLASFLPAAALPPEDEVWRGVDTPGFSVLGNASAVQIDSVAHNLEALRLVLSRLGSGPAGGVDPIPVIVFDRASSFDPYRAGMGNAKNIAGFYTEGTGDRFIAMNVAAGDSPYPTVYHEYLHSIVRQQFGRVPLWFNEGIAGVYETFTREGNKAIVGKPSRERLGYMADHAWRPLAEILLVDDDARLHDRDDEATSAFYAQSWLLVHDILFGHPERLKQLSAFLEAYSRGKPQREAFEQSFVGGIAGVEAELKAYMRGRLPYVTVTFDDLTVAQAGSVRVLPRAEVLLALGRLVVTSPGGSTTEAAKHFKAARALAPGDPRVSAGLGLVAYREEREDDAAKLLDAAADAGLDDSAALEVAGRLAFGREDTSRARDLASRALAKRPADADLLVLYGLTFVGDEGEAPQGIAALERAEQIEPDRADVLSGLVALHAQARDRGKAETAARRAEALGKPEVTARVRDSLALLDLTEAQAAVAAEDFPKALELLRAARERTARESLRSDIDRHIVELEAMLAKKKLPAKR